MLSILHDSSAGRVVAELGHPAAEPIDVLIHGLDTQEDRNTASEKLAAITSDFFRLAHEL